MWRFIPIMKTTLWGGNRIPAYKGMKSRLQHIGESWEISGLPGAETVVDGGPDDGLTLTQLVERHGEALLGKRNYQRFGNSFPLLVKIIDAAQDLSVQVHPDDALAQRRSHPNGKSEMWYVLSKKGGRIANGFTRPLDPAELDVLLTEGSLPEVLRYIDIEQGDVIHIPAGRVHALGAGSMVVEVQQTSDVTYRLYDYGRLDFEGKPRDLHVDLARDAIDYDATEASKVSYTPRMNVPCTVLSTPEFTTGLLVLDHEIMRDYGELDTFVVLVCTQGSAHVTCGSVSADISRGRTLLIPADVLGVTINPAPSATLLEIRC